MRVLDSLVTKIALVVALATHAGATPPLAASSPTSAIFVDAVRTKEQLNRYLDRVLTEKSLDALGFETEARWARHSMEAIVPGFRED